MGISNKNAAQSQSNNEFSAEAAEKTFKKAVGKIPPQKASKAQKILGWLMFTIIIIPTVMMAVKGLISFIKEVQKDVHGLKTPKGVVTKLETDGETATGDQLVEAAMEGLRARAKAKREEADREFNRRVAAAVKSATQGSNKMVGPDFRNHEA